jgi:hypothetical protein
MREDTTDFRFFIPEVDDSTAGRQREPAAGAFTRDYDRADAM